MYVGRDYGIIEPGETDTFSLEFTNDLTGSQTLLSAVWTCALVRTEPGATVDPTPSARLSGSSGVSTTTDAVTLVTRSFANQKAGGMIDGNTYRLEATASTSDGRTLQLWSHVRCKAGS